MPVELGSITLQHLEEVLVRGRARVVRHPVPGMSGDLSQSLGRSSVEVVFQGIFYGDSASDDLQQLRNAYLEHQPIEFFTESVGEGYFTQVLITSLDITQRAGYLNQFDYKCVVMEYIEPPELSIADPFAAIDTDILGDAIAFVDDIQNALEEVSNLVDLLANFPNFGDPTGQLPDMLDEFNTLIDGDDGAISTLTGLRDLF